jgi:RIO kinase 1
MTSKREDFELDTWTNIDFADDEFDKLSRKNDRKFTIFKKRIKDTEQFKVEANVFDDSTYAALYKLVQDGHIIALGGPISSGKEAIVFEAYGRDNIGLAIKIYRINTSSFRQMKDYLTGDPRFSNIGSDKRDIVLAWTRKEFANLKRARDGGVRVPEPIAVKMNVLVMELIGVEGNVASKLQSIELENPLLAYQIIRDFMRKLHLSGLVHGDLSEYNILVHDGELCIIDIGQAVTHHHPNASKYLHRDCQNISKFFSRKGVETSEEILYNYITQKSS